MQTATTHSGRDVITMAAIAAVPAIPNENAYLARVADRFRALARKTIQVVKKAGNWIINLTPVNWVWNKTKFIGSKIWGWAKPAARWTEKFVVKPAAIAGGAAVGFVFGSKLIALLAALGVVGLIAVTIYVVRKRRKEKIVAVEVEVAPEAPQEPEEKPEKPKRVIKKVTKTVTETTEEATPEGINEAVAEVAAQMTEALNQTETPEVPAEPAPVNGNGTYKVRLPEGDLIPTETLDERFYYLEGLLKAEESKDSPDKEYICELQGRQNLIHVRAGQRTQIKKDATTKVAHQDLALRLETDWKIANQTEVLGPKEVTGIYRSALYQGAVAENTRLNKVVRLKVEHDKLKGKAA